MKVNKEIKLLLISSLFILFYLFTRPFIFFVAEDSILMAIPANADKNFTIRFIHSVQKTPVEENLRVNDGLDGFILESTKYQSFGVGLPFLLNEGDFRREGYYFIFENINRQLKNLSLRVGVGNELTIIYQQKEYPIYQKVKLGSKIELKIAPYYKRFFAKSNL